MKPTQLLSLLVFSVQLSVFPSAGLCGDDPVVATARSLIAAKRLPEAREPLEQLLAADADNLEARLLLARCYNGLQRYEDTIDLLEPVINSPARDKPLTASHFAIYAEACLMRADTLGTSFRALGLARRGRNALEKASSLSPQNITYREGLVEFYRHAPGLAGGSRAKALAHARAVTLLDPLRGGLLEASILADEKRFAEALDRCDSALAAAPDSYLALYTLGRIAADSGLRPAEGTAALQRCLDLTPSPAEPPHSAVYFRLGLIEEKQKHPQEAQSHFEASLRLAPDYCPAQEALRRVQ